jgi:hypothetical protein
VDRKHNSTIRSIALRFIYSRGEQGLGDTFYRSGTRLQRSSDGHLIAWVYATWEDVGTMRRSTRTHTATDMPGTLDLAFEAATGEWPLFKFVIDPAHERAA